MEHRVRDVSVASFQQNLESNGGGGGSSSAGGVEEHVVRWERFLPRRNLRVLLVENDDSTRHIVSALLRKCSYQVAAVADGLKAWKVLKERHYNFDLVLTEVVMPSLSGIGLLSKIMSNEICKNIPVIMMSSHDSIGIVFKCMMKGAADFLVKPVRKNELRNLWQHVWRKCCASNGGDGFENENIIDTKAEGAPDNEAASNYASSNAGNRSKIGDNSEESDSQSSCSRPDIRTESTQKQEDPVHNDYRRVEETDVKLEKSEISMDKIATTIHDKGKEKESSTDIEIQLTLAIHKAFSTENQEVNCSSYWKDDQDSIRSKKGGDIDQNAGLHLPSKEIVGFLETTTRKHTSQVLEVTDSVEYCLPESARSSDALRTASVSGSLPLWELSLKSQLKGKDKDVLPEKHVLKHSEASAFSRYVNGGSPLFCPGSTVSNSYVKTKECGTSIRQRYSSDDNRSSIVFPLFERPSLSHVYGDETSTQCQLSSGRNKEDADPSPFLPSREDASVSPSPTAKTVPTHLQYGCAPVSIPVTANSFQTLCSTYGTVLQPFFYPESSVSFHGSVVATKELVAAPSKPSMDNCNKPQHVNGHFYHANHHSHQWFQGVDDQRTNVNPTHPRVALHTPAEQIPVASGSNGAYGEKGFAANTGVAIESGSDRDRSRREAALNKFRLKRKDRCFEKKVRYHNRQKLAEQRPRIKGQFVRQTVGESNCGVAESDD